MDKTSTKPKTSLRNPLAALASVMDKMAESEPQEANRRQKQVEAAKARELAAREPKAQ